MDIRLYAKYLSIIVVVIIILIACPNIIVTALLILLFAITIGDVSSRVKRGGGDCTYRGFEQLFNNANGGYKRENVVREMFNCFVLNGQFVEANAGRVPWLFRTDESGKKIYLDFDGYNEQAKIAFEYNGPAHYDNIYNKPPRKFLQYIDNDRIKSKLAAEHGITFIIIPYTIRDEYLMDYIRSRLLDCKQLKFDRRRDYKFNRRYDYIDKVAEPAVRITSDLPTLEINVKTHTSQVV